MTFQKKHLFRKSAAFVALSIAASIAGVSCASAASPHISKLEARRVRQACVARIDQQGGPGSERSAKVAACVARRIAHFAEARECRAEGEAKGVETSKRREFMQACIAEKTGEKPGEPAGEKTGAK